jgi:hypothetical protein
VVSAAVGLGLGGLRTGGSILAGVYHLLYHHHEERQDDVWFQLADLVDSSGGGGPGESPVSTKTTLPSVLLSKGRPIPLVGQGVPAAGKTTRGGGPRKRCPEGYHWNARVGECMPDFIGWKRGPYGKG